MKGKVLRKQCRAFLVRLVKRLAHTSHAEHAERLLLAFDDLPENNNEMLVIMQEALRLLTAREGQGRHLEK